MASKHLFRSAARRIEVADAVNEAGGKAYARSARQALAQYAATGCFGTTFYATEGEQLERVLSLCSEVDDDFIARTAVYARQRAHMKDMPALLLAVLAGRGSDRLERVFNRVCDNGKLLRGFVQVIRSGVTGRRSLGTRPKRLVQQWLATKSDPAILRAAVGNEPSLADVIKMVHPTPADASRRALYGWLVGRPYDPQALPEVVTAYEAYKTGASTTLPDVSGSMHAPATGRRKGATTVVRCIDVAALVAAAIVRGNREASVLPFHDRVERCELERRDSIMTNAKKLAALPSGGTDCAAPLRELNRRKATGDLVVFVSDNESWISRDRSYNAVPRCSASGRSTGAATLAPSWCASTYSRAPPPRPPTAPTSSTWEASPTRCSS